MSWRLELLLQPAELELSVVLPAVALLGLQQPGLSVELPAVALLGLQVEPALRLAGRLSERRTELAQQQRLWSKENLSFSFSLRVVNF
jgi:hypothetical protein